MTMKRQTAVIILPILIAGWLSVNTEAFGISSFGKASTDPPKPPTPTPSTARPCRRQAECAGVASSSCVRTHYDAATRCLCPDNSPPINGQCEAQAKNLYHVCSNSDECLDGLICGTPNITGIPPPHLAVHAPQDKICLCDVDSGLKERDHSCSDADIVKTSVLAIFLVSCMRKLLVY